MPFQLPDDTTLSFPHFPIISASAGSGKTHTLTQKLLQLLLSSRVPNNRLRNILAITFTNNAAAEMRQRVLDTLKRAALGNPDTIAELKLIIDADEETLRQRASILVDTVLQDFSFFQIQTIDSFLTRVFRASAIEFGLPPTIQVVLNGNALLDRAFEQFTRDLADKPALRGLMEELTDLLVETSAGSSRFIWDPFTALANEVRSLYEFLSAHPKDIRLDEKSFGEYRECSTEVLRLFADLRKIAEQSGLEITHNFLLACGDADANDIEGLIRRAAVTNPPLKKSGDNASKKKRVEETHLRCEPLQHRLEELRPVFFMLRARTCYAPFIRALELFRSTIDQVSWRVGQITLGDLNRSLVKSMSASAVPQIYLYLGDTIFHYLIDEFQDTSPIQWQALYPLIEETLSKQGSLFIVGDTKQSIYAFRHADWRIMRRLQTEQVFASVGAEPFELDTNYRSAEQLVEYTKELFHHTVPALTDVKAVEASGLSSYTQHVHEKKRGRGYVETMTFEPDEDREPEREKIVTIVLDCLNRGYRHADITILTPKNAHVVAVSSWLNQAGIPFVSHSSLDIRRRPVIGDVLALLRFLNSPVDDLAFAEFLLSRTFALAEQRAEFTEQVRTFLLEAVRPGHSHGVLYTRFRSAFVNAWTTHFEHLMNVTGYLPMYDLVCEIVRQFRLFERWPGEEAALTKFLETVISYEQTGANALREFLAFAGEDSADSDWSVDAPTNVDAVSIMTIHKAKGLGKRVVIVLLVDTRPQATTLYIDEQEESIELLYIRSGWGKFVPRLNELVEMEIFRRTVDELNRLYVALTRAQDEMYILNVKKEHVTGQSVFFPTEPTSRGIKGVAELHESRSAETAPVSHRTTRADRQVSFSGKLGHFERQRGELFHAILSRVFVLQEDIGAQIKNLSAEIASTMDEPVGLDDACSILERFLETPAIHPFFESRDGRSALTEQEIVDAQGRLFRLDRIIVDVGAASVVDYKTGGDSAEYDEQILNYMDLLKQLYPNKTVHGFLAFIDRRSIREVLR